MFPQSSTLQALPFVSSCFQHKINAAQTSRGLIFKYRKSVSHGEFQNSADSF